jgi:hypothetical protein
VEVQILTGRRFTLVVDQANETVRDIQEKIRSKEGIHPDLQLLLYNGIFIVAGMTVRELQLHEGSLLFMTLRNRGG